MADNEPAAARKGFFQTRRGQWLGIVVTVFAVIGLGVLGYWYLYARNYQETDDAYVLELELPGVRKDDVNIEVRDNEVRVGGHAVRRRGRR